MQREHLESAAAKVLYLRGLLAIPLGLFFILTGLGNLKWGPVSHTWVFLACLLVLGGAFVGIQRYYSDNYGRVTPAKGQQMRNNAVNFILLLAGMVGGSLLDFSFDLPVSLFSVSFALAILAWFAICVGLKMHHIIIWGALLVVGLLPLWGALPDKVSIAWLPIGVATVATGIFDHRALVRTFGSARDLKLENSNVGA